MPYGPSQSGLQDTTISTYFFQCGATATHVCDLVECGNVIGCNVRNHVFIVYNYQKLSCVFSMLHRKLVLLQAVVMLSAYCHVGQKGFTCSFALLVIEDSSACM